MKSFRINPPAPSTPVMTEEDKQARAMQFLVAKREQYAVNILSRLCQGMSYDILRTDVNVREKVTDLVDISVKMADQLLEKLYPIKEEESK